MNVVLFLVLMRPSLHSLQFRSKFHCTIPVFVVFFCMSSDWNTEAMCLHVLRLICSSESLCWESQSKLDSPQLEWRDLPMYDYVGDFMYNWEVLCDYNTRAKKNNNKKNSPQKFTGCHSSPWISIFLKVFAKLQTNYAINPWDSWKGKGFFIVRLAQIWRSSFKRAVSADLGAISHFILWKTRMSDFLAQF